MIKSIVLPYNSDRPTIKELINNIFGNSGSITTETKPIEKKSIGEPLNNFETDEKKIEVRNKKHK